MSHCITIASACHLYYRKTCLIPNTNVSEPVRSCHHKGRVHSKAALEWLYWKEHCEGQSEPQTSRTGDRNAHTCNQGEHKLLIGGSELYVDGFDHSKNKVYKFLGDFYHDSPMTFSDRGMRHPFHTHKTMQEAYEETLERLNAIKKAGYEVEVMWEHEWNQLKKEREVVREFVNQLNLVTRLEPRDAFFDGRTNAVQLYRLARVEEGEEIWYADYTSLYPWVNKNYVYPVGYPTIITHPQTLKEADVLSDYFGLVKCTVLPRYGLHFAGCPIGAEASCMSPV